MDNNDSSYEWDYQGSMRNNIRTDKHLESITFHRQDGPQIVEKQAKNQHIPYLLLSTN